MTPTVDQEFARAVGRRIVEEVAPAELRMFEIQADEFFADPRGALRFKKDRDERLDIGVGEVLPILTPIALVIAAEVGNYLTEEVTRAAVERTADAVRKAVRRMITRQRDPGQPILEVPSGTEIRIRQIVTEVSISGEVSDDKIRMISNIISRPDGSTKMQHGQRHP